MRSSVLILFLLAACSQSAEKSATPVAATGSLAGLYEGKGTPTTPSRICMTGEGDQARFGLATSTEEPTSCTARGRVRRTGSALTLVIDGDPACTLAMSVTATGLTLAGAAGAECGYYCGRGAQFSPGDFAKVGAAPADIRRAVDIAGDPLCS